MPKDLNEELERLESELLRADATKKLPVVEVPEEQYEEAEEEYEEEYEEAYEEEYEEEEEPEYTAYSNQPCDVDLEEYAAQVEEEPKNKGLGFLTALFVVLTTILCICIWMFLKFGGFLG